MNSLNGQSQFSKEGGEVYLTEDITLRIPEGAFASDTRVTCKYQVHLSKLIFKKWTFCNNLLMLTRSFGSLLGVTIRRADYKVFSWLILCSAI